LARRRFKNLFFRTSRFVIFWAHFSRLRREKPGYPLQPKTPGSKAAAFTLCSLRCAQTPKTKPPRHFWFRFYPLRWPVNTRLKLLCGMSIDTASTAAI
jgi:hypothetical protein